jgi:chromosome segregation ATPase
MKKMSLLITAGLLFSFVLAFGQGAYKWVDEKGTVHFTDDPSLIPERYQDQVRETKPQGKPAPASVESRESVGKEKEIESAPESASEQKDLLGRGEEWWRATVSEWNKKLKTARENYEDAYNKWKAKEQELEASQFKPDSVKRKLKAEVKALEENVKDWEKQVEEAKNMLDNVLPKQAEDDHANPEWLNPEEP